MIFNANEFIYSACGWCDYWLKATDERALERKCTHASTNQTIRLWKPFNRTIFDIFIINLWCRIFALTYLHCKHTNTWMQWTEIARAEKEWDKEYTLSYIRPDYQKHWTIWLTGWLAVGWICWLFNAMQFTNQMLTVFTDTHIYRHRSAGPFGKCDVNLKCRKQRTTTKTRTQTLLYNPTAHIFTRTQTHCNFIGNWETGKKTAQHHMKMMIWKIV